MQCGVVGNRLVTSPVKVARAARCSMEDLRRMLPAARARHGAGHAARGGAALSSLASYTPEKKLSRKQSVCSL
jgi:hypothetical protein